MKNLNSKFFAPLLLSFIFVSTASAEEEKSECLLAGEGVNAAQVKANNTDACLTSSELVGALDLTTPESALFTLMGSTPDNVIRPKVGDKISWSFLPQAVNALKGEEFAVGFEINPGLMMIPETYAISNLRGKTDGLADFRDSSVVETLQRAKFLSQFTLSGAASKSTGDIDMTRYGVGLNFTHDTGSPLFGTGKFADCVTPEDWLEYEDKFAKQVNDLTKIFKSNNPTASVAEIDRYTENEAVRLVEASDWNAKSKVSPPTIDNCVAEVAPWNRDVYGAGLALYHSDVEAGDPADMMMADMTMGDMDMPRDQTGYGAWASVAIQSGKQGQFTLSARYNDDLVRERTAMDEAITESVDGWRLGGRYTRSFSKTDKAKGGAIRGFVEAAYAEEDFGLINDNFTQAGIGVELQLQENLFFQATIGDTFGSEIDRSTYLSGQFKWSFSKAAAK